MFSRVAKISPTPFCCLVLVFFSYVIYGVTESRAYMQTSEAVMSSKLKK